MFDNISDAALMAMIGLTGGAVLGLAARLGRFCTLGAIEDYLYQDSDRRMRMWALAIAIAGAGTFLLIAAGLLDPARTMYHAAPFSPLASILGGLIFGYGMSLAGTCGFGALARAGGGDLRAFVIVLVMGVASYMMISGPLAAARVWLVDATTLDTALRSIPEAAEQITGFSSVYVGLGLSLILLVMSLSSPTFRASRASVFWGIAVGLTVAASWGATFWVVTNGFSAQTAQSFTFSAPLGETLLYLMTSSGGGLSFGVGSVLGVVLGACAGSLLQGHFRWEACEDPRELRRQCGGAVLMGFGAVLAFGCTIGQGLSAFSLFVFSAPLTVLAIIVGAALGLRQLITGFTAA